MKEEGRGAADFAADGGLDAGNVLGRADIRKKEEGKNKDVNSVAYLLVNRLILMPKS